MDPQRFDTLARSLHDLRSRRGALGALLGGTLGLLELTETESKKKKKRKKKRQSNPPTPTCPDGQRLCRGTCLPFSICCDNGDCAGGRTCQAGTCACSAPTPYICPGSTLCRQCCAKTDCYSGSPTLQGTGVPQCSAHGVCVCSTAGTRYCGGWCGFCCSNADCTNQQTCQDSANGNYAYECRCTGGDLTCTGAGRTGCVPQACAGACGAACNPQNDTPCPCAADLICDFDSANPNLGYFCAPR